MYLRIIADPVHDVMYGNPFWSSHQSFLNWISQEQMNRLLSIGSFRSRAPALILENMASRGTKWRKAALMSFLPDRGKENLEDQARWFELTTTKAESLSHPKLNN
jgi:hypothetical protein